MPILTDPFFKKDRRCRSLPILYEKGSADADPLPILLILILADPLPVLFTDPFADPLIGKESARKDRHQPILLTDLFGRTFADLRIGQKDRSMPILSGRSFADPRIGKGSA